MKGVRLPDGLLAGVWFKHGDYMRDETGKWWLRPPRGSMGDLDGHTVTEHEDGTITVEPSIAGDDWHGYLERGVWRDC